MKRQNVVLRRISEENILQDRERPRHEAHDDCGVFVASEDEASTGGRRRDESGVRSWKVSSRSGSTTNDGAARRSTSSSSGSATNAGAMSLGVST